MLKKFFTLVGRDFLPSAAEKEKSLVIETIKLLIKANLLVLNHEELEKVTRPTPSRLSQGEIEILKSMSLQMLDFELNRLSEEEKEQRKKDGGAKISDSHLLDFADTICANFEIPTEMHEEIRIKCLSRGWEAIKIDGLAIELARLKKKKRTKKI